jgi:hypothetical protein
MNGDLAMTRQIPAARGALHGSAHRAALIRRSAAVALLAGALGCGTASPPPPGWLARLAAAPRLASGDAWSPAPDRIEHLLETAAIEPLEQRRTAAGATGAERVTAWVPLLGRTLNLKWKRAPSRDLDGIDNSPRKEIAAYQVQRWFLDPEDYVVPPTAGRCVPLAVERRIHPNAQPNLPGVRCVFGVYALWLSDVRTADRLYDPERFYREASYARRLADYNLFTYLIDDRDTREANVLISTDPAERRVYAIDNGVAFDPRFYNVFADGWRRIRVPALPRETIARLRRVTRAQVDHLAVVAEFTRDRDGVLRAVRPGPPLDAERAVYFRNGVLQLGLDRREREGVWDRIQDLLRRVDAGALPVF